MKMYRLVLIAVLVVFAALPAAGQVRFLEEGQNGFGLSAGLGTGEDYSSLGANFGYGISGRYEVGLGFSKVSFDDEVIGNDGSGTAFAPYFLAAVIKPTEASMFGLELGAAYEIDSYSSDALDYNNWDMSGKAFTAGASLYLKVPASPTVTIYPSLSVGYVTLSVEIEDSYGDSVDDDTSDAAIGASVAFLFNNKIWLSPSFRTFDGNSSYGLSVGFSLPQ
jgi:hypothetical protein